MDYSFEYWQKNPTYHVEDAPRKCKEILTLTNCKYNSIIDIGCGAGYLTEMLYRALSPQKMFGIDISEDAIKIAKKHGNNKIQYMVDDIRNSNIRTSFDLGIVADLVEHLDDDKKFIDDVFKHSKTVIIRVPCEKNKYNDLLLKLGISNEYEGFEKRYGHIHHYNVSDLLTLFTSRNVKVLDYNIFYLGKRTKFINNIPVLLSKFIGFFSKRVSIDLFGGFVVFKLEKTYVRSNTK